MKCVQSVNLVNEMVMQPVHYKLFQGKYNNLRQ